MHRNPDQIAPRLIAAALAALVALVALVGLTATAPTVSAQEPPSAAAAGEAGPADGEMQAAIRQYFQNRLRRELQLTDEQVERILPRVESMERARDETRRQRARLVRDLRQGLDGGAGDDRLAALLAELEAVELTQRDRERELLASIDDDLTVRQRVQLRFFVEEFRRELQRRVRAVRGDAGRARGRVGPAAGGRRPGARDRR